MKFVEPIRNKNDLKKIKKALKRSNQRDYILFLFGINTGLRVSDILALDIKDVKSKDCVVLRERKTKKIKQILLNSKLKKAIQKFVGDECDETKPLFTTKFGNRMDRIQAYRIIKKVCKEVNPSLNVGTHTMRKTFAYHHYKRFKDIAILQKILNHSSPTITLKYIGIEQDEINRFYKKFSL